MEKVNKEEIEKEFNKITRKLNKVTKKLDSLYEERNTIINNPIVQKYIEIQSNIERSKIERDEVKNDFINLKQKRCCHPLYIITSTSEDDYECRTSYECKCIECGHEEILRNRDLKENNAIECNTSYYEMKKEYETNKRKFLEKYSINNDSKKIKVK